MRCACRRRAAKLSELSTGRAGGDSGVAAALLAGALAATATRSAARADRVPASARRSDRLVDSLVNLARKTSRSSPRLQLSSPARSVAPMRPFSIASA